MSAASRPCAAPAMAAAKTAAAMNPSDLKRLLDIDTPCRGICGLQQVRAIIPSWFSPGAQPQGGSTRLESVDRAPGTAGRGPRPVISPKSVTLTQGRFLTLAARAVSETLPIKWGDCPLRSLPGLHAS